MTHFPRAYARNFAKLPIYFFTLKKKNNKKRPSRKRRVWVDIDLVAQIALNICESFLFFRPVQIRLSSVFGPSLKRARSKKVFVQSSPCVFPGPARRAPLPSGAPLEPPPPHPPTAPFRSIKMSDRPAAHRASSSRPQETFWAIQELRLC